LDAVYIVSTSITSLLFGQNGEGESLMHVEPRLVQTQTSIAFKARTPAFKRFGITTICLILIAVVAGIALLPGGVITRAIAAGTTPSQPTFIDGVAGNQQVSLSWGVSENATGYLVERLDLATGQALQLPTMVTETSSTIGSLAAGRWYRFRIIPVNGTVQGAPSASIEIRTIGFQGTYAHYYVLGDSYSAGEGAPPYSGIKGCYRSVNSYGNQLGSGAPTPVIIACSGAVADDIDKITQIAGLAGTQLQPLHRHPLTNSLITLTIGGNDANFAQELQDCIFGLHACTSRREAISQRIAALEPRLAQVYREIRSAAPGADIIVLGYPLLAAAPDVASCHNPIIKVGLSKSEMSMIRDLAGQLNRVITQAAAQAGVISAADRVEQAFVGHEVCTKSQQNEWINEITGITNMIHGSFHPKLAGYTADAHAVNAGRIALYQTGMVRRV
jgi:lysophospholipase L1-like esterase